MRTSTPRKRSFAEALASALADQQQRLEQDQRKGLDLEGAIRRYRLNRAHLKESASGCPRAALLPEVARQAQVHPANLRRRTAKLCFNAGRIASGCRLGNERPPRDGHLRPDGGHSSARARRTRRCASGADSGRRRRGRTPPGAHADLRRERRKRAADWVDGYDQAIRPGKCVLRNLGLMGGLIYVAAGFTVPSPPAVSVAVVEAPALMKRRGPHAAHLVSAVAVPRVLAENPRT